MIRTIQEYYSVGHDTPEPLYTSELLQTGRKKISMIFGGIGDARNLHCTLLNIMADEMQRKIKDKRKAGSGKLFHFTIVDIKPAAIARDLVVFLLLSEIADQQGDKASKLKHKLLPCLYYTYLAPIMPRDVFDVLQKKIETMIDMLEGQRELPNFLDVPNLYRPQIVRVLKQWQSEAAEDYPASRMRQQAVLGRKQSEMSLMMHGMQYGMDTPTPTSAPRGCVKEKNFYEATGMLPLAPTEYKLYRPELRSLIEGSSSGPSKDVVSAAADIGNETWATNVTLVDLDWQHNRPSDSFDIDVGHNPFEFAEKLGELGLIPPNPRGLYDYLDMWFSVVASAVGELRHRMKIEACVGDITAVLEQIRYGVVGHREELAEGNYPDRTATQSLVEPVNAAPGLEDTNEYPRMYDRIHLSNIPDYIGGTLSSFLYALPITHLDKSSYITSTNLRNPPRFKTTASFDNEYITMSAPSDLAKVFEVKMEPLTDPNEQMPTCRYNVWQHHRIASKNLQGLMPRNRLESWLKRLFLKIAIPKDKREIESWVLIYSPVNFTMFLRLLTHLHNVGYPSHWLGGIWSEILSGRMGTSARAPRTEPLTMKEVKTAMPAIQHSTAPFVAELTTLTALWQPILPFVVPTSTLPVLQDVHKYSVRFQSVSDSAANNPAFVLVFYNQEMLAVGDVTSLRKHLLDDELGLPKQSPSARKINDEGIHIMTTWTYDRPSKTATFWFRNDVLQRLKSGPAAQQWRVAIWRTDNYTRQSSTRTLGHIYDHGAWSSGEDAPMPEPSSSDEQEDESDENEEDWEDDSDIESFGGQYPPSSNPQMNMLTDFMDSVMQGMPGDSRDQRLRLAQQLMEEGVRDSGRR